MNLKRFWEWLAPQYSLTRFTLVSHTRQGSDYILEGTWESGECATFRGNTTVWLTYPDGVRCSTPVETLLADIYKRLEWERKTADKNDL